VKTLRLIPLSIGWAILGLSVLIFYAATGLGWIGEQVMQLAFGGSDV